MTYTYNNKGTCSVRTVVELNDDHTIKSVQVLGGCDGNLKGIETKMCVCYMQKIVRVFHCFSSPQQFLQDFSVGCRQRHAK